MDRTERTASHAARRPPSTPRLVAKRLGRGYARDGEEHQQRAEELLPTLSPPSEHEPSRSNDSGDLVVGLLALLVFVPFYLAPTLVTLARGHNNVAPIFVVNFFLGWCLVGWVIAIAWAFTDLKHLEHRRRSYL